MLRWRGIDGEPCAACDGSGVKVYSNTSTWRKSIGGNMMSADVCDRCWGAGRADEPWTNLRELFAKMDERVAARAMELLANAAGANYTASFAAAREIADELDKLSRGRKARAPWFQNMCISLAKTLRRGSDAAATLLAQAKEATNGG